MMIYKVRTDSTVQWTGAIAQNASGDENIALTSGLAGMNGKVENILRGLSIVSKENLAWELDFYSSNTFATASPDTNKWLGRWTFAATDAKQIGGTGLWEYYIDGMELPLWDDDTSGTAGSATNPIVGTGKLHVSLVNRSAASKTAGTNGALVVTFWLEPMQAGSGA